MSAVLRLLIVGTAVIAASVSARAQQPVAWEKLPFLYDDGGGPVDDAHFVGFLPSSGADSLIVTGGNGTFIFDPDADNGVGAWERRERYGSDYALITEHGTLLIAPGGAREADRSTDHGHTWQESLLGTGYRCTAFHQSNLSTLRGPSGGTVFCASVYTTYRSLGDGAPGTWEALGEHGGEGVAYGDVTPSSALPEGRLLAGVYNGITYSDDGGTTWHSSSLYGFARAIVHAFTWVPKGGHPYGGAALASVQDLALGGNDSTATVWRSDDGGMTWASVHRFSPIEHGIPRQPSGVYRLTQFMLLTASDGVVWAGLFATVPGPDPGNGSVARSFDGGRTWEVAMGPGWGGRGVLDLTEGPDGRIYAAAEAGGVWRTVAPVVAVAGEPEAPDLREIDVSIEPNPSTGRASVHWRQASAGAVRVTLHDVRGREVAVLADSYRQPGEHRAEIETGSLAPGVYVVRVVSADGVTSARLTVAR